MQGREPEGAWSAPAAGKPLEMALVISAYIAEYTALRTAMGCLLPNSSTTSTLPATTMWAGCKHGRTPCNGNMVKLSIRKIEFRTELLGSMRLPVSGMCKGMAAEQALPCLPACGKRVDEGKGK